MGPAREDDASVSSSISEGGAFFSTFSAGDSEEAEVSTGDDRSTDTEDPGRRLPGAQAAGVGEQLLEGAGSDAGVAIVGPEANAARKLLHTLTWDLLTKAVNHHRRKLASSIQDPFQGTRRHVFQSLNDWTMTRAQQEVVQRVIKCNKNFWDVAVEGKTAHGHSVPWRRHVCLNMVLLAIYHSHVAAERCRETLVACIDRPPPMSKAFVEDALRYLRWALAAYSKEEQELLLRAGIAQEAAVQPSTLYAWELCDAQQAQDPLCPRYVITIDAERREVILAVRGTSSLSDAMVDLIGDPVPFGGGMAHSGILDGARRLYQKCASQLEKALAQLEEQNGPRYCSCASNEVEEPATSFATADEPGATLVLTGHSLGAGVVQILSIILCGGDDGWSSVRRLRSTGSTMSVGSAEDWVLPPNVRLKTFLYAPPPAFRLNDDAEQAHPEAAAAAKLAASSAVGFATNYDIIPRTSLHNGFNLFQQARVVDSHVRWRKRDIFKLLRKVQSEDPREAEESRQRVIAAVSDAIKAAAEGPPPAPNPFARQHPVAAQMYHFVGTSGGTIGTLPRQMLSIWEFAGIDPPKEAASAAAAASAASSSVTPPPAVPAPAMPPPAVPLLPAAPLPVDAGVGVALDIPMGLPTQLFKKSKVVGEWRMRHAWVEDGNFCFSHDEARQRVTASVPLASAATTVWIFGEPSAEQFPQTVVLVGEDGLGITPMDDNANDPVPTPLRKKAPTTPTPWAFRVQTQAVGGFCGCRAGTLDLCAESPAARDAWIWQIVEAIRAARSRSFVARPAVRPEQWGREALLADGFADDHSIRRYEIILETLADRVSHAAGDALPGREISSFS